MGTRINAAKASLAVLFVAASGVPVSSATAAANPDSASWQGIVSSYFGPLGLQNSFESFVQQNGYPNFQQWWKDAPNGAACGATQFSFSNNVAPPPGISVLQKCLTG